jgi:hypothetical protein
MATANPSSLLAQRSAQETQTLHDDIRARWSKLSDYDVGALKDADDLMTQVATRYTLDAEQARADVVALLQGRKI